MANWLPIEALLVFVLQFFSSIQEPLPLKGNDSCLVYPGQRVTYECTTLSTTLSTKYEIILSDSTPCTLTLLNGNQHLYSEDQCPDGSVFASLIGINESNSVSNISVTVPNVAVPTSPIVIMCLSEGIPEPVGTATLDIILNDGFPFPGIVNLATEQGACVFSIDTNCSLDDYTYVSSTNCSNCAYNGGVFICNDVSPEEYCRFSVRAVLNNNLTSQDSDPIFCTYIVEATSYATTLADATSSSSSNAVAIAISVVILVAVSVVVGIIVFGILYYRRKRSKQKQPGGYQQSSEAPNLDNSQLHLVQPPSNQSSALKPSHDESSFVKHSPNAIQPSSGSRDHVHEREGIPPADGSAPRNNNDGVGSGTNGGDNTEDQSDGQIEAQQFDERVSISSPQNINESSTPISSQSPQDNVNQLCQQVKMLNEAQIQMKKDLDERVNQIERKCEDQVNQVEKKCEDQLLEMRAGKEEMEGKLSELMTAVEMKTQQLAEKDSKISYLEKLISQKDTELEIKGREVSQRDRELEITIQNLNQKESVIELQKSTINDLKTERDKLKEEVFNLRGELEDLKKQVVDMKENLESKGDEKERRDEAQERRIQEAFEILAKALNINKTMNKDTAQREDSGGMQQQAMQPIITEMKVDKQDAELKITEEVSRHEDVKNNVVDCKTQNGSSASIKDTTPDLSVRYDHSVSEDNNTEYSNN